MEWIYLVLGIAALISCGWQPSLADSISDEIADNTVQLKFYYVSSSQWKKTAEFQQVLSTQATEYCKQNTAQCGLQQHIKFLPDNVNISGGYPKDDKSNLILQFCILYPAGAPVFNGSTTKMVLPKAVTYAVAGSTETRESLHSKTTYSLIEISYGSEVKKYQPYPNTQMNLIMSIVGFLVLIIVIATAVGCHLYRKNQKRKERIAKLSKNLKNKQYSNQTYENKVSPLDDMEMGNIPWEHNRSRDNLRDGDGKVKKTKKSRSTKADEGKPNNALPPLETELTEKKKKKKKKKGEKERRKEKDKLVKEGKKAHRSKQAEGRDNDTFDYNETLNSTGTFPDLNKTTESGNSFDLNATTKNGHPEFNSTAEISASADATLSAGYESAGAVHGAVHGAVYGDSTEQPEKPSSVTSEKCEFSGTGTTTTYMSDDERVKSSAENITKGAPETQTTEL
ncbi:uncharacterized protein LOC106156000 [Lingula anatina]|uniref:Uncharacterized protein LOC106156000 n=1 Tax=Lingula anatina TaxID=7574 RepID=A0A1S3HK67_LINAN|nr:uncharacterized protein LOC106156000 [Lingula anatina]|eukprot:XP_013386510.1 uncharacterized protein LOC106156000 [Lingula anatina]